MRQNVKQNDAGSKKKINEDATVNERRILRGVNHYAEKEAVKEMKKLQAQLEECRLSCVLGIDSKHRFRPC